MQPCTNSYRNDLRGELEKGDCLIWLSFVRVSGDKVREKHFILMRVGEVGDLAPTNNSRKMISAKRGLEAMKKYRACVKSRPDPTFPSLFSCTAQCTPHLSLFQITP